MNETNKMFLALIEVKPLPECDFLDLDIDGAIVVAYRNCKSMEDAISELLLVLAEDRLQLIEMHWCRSWYEHEWIEGEFEAEAEPFDRAEKTGGIEFGTFHPFGADDDDK